MLLAERYIISVLCREVDCISHRNNFTFNVKVGICRSVIAAEFEALLCSSQSLLVATESNLAC